MTNPFTQAQPAAAPAQGQPNPYAQQPTPAQAPGVATPQPQFQQPQAQAPQQQQFPPQQTQAAAGADPFGDVPDQPTDGDFLTSADADANTVIILKVKAAEQYVSKFPDQKTGQPKQGTRLITDVTIVTGPKKGLEIIDQWIQWNSVVRQFASRAGDGRVYLIQLYKDGQAIKAQPVQDPQMKLQAQQYL